MERKYDVMRSLARVVGSIVAALAVAAAVAAQPPASFNVRDFGAKGDGKTDDTAAIQRALDAAAAAIISGQPYKGAAYWICAPTVWFPAGRYRISAPLRVRANIAGEGGAVIEQVNPDADIFVGDHIWRWRVSGLTFLGGRRQLRIGNPNIDTGHIVIEDCAFYLSRGPAIELLPDTRSTLLTVRDCVFYACRQVLVNYADMAVFADCWVTTSREMKNQAAFVNHGVLLIERMLGVPLVGPDNDQRWIDNYGSVICRDARFGGEFGGMTVVVNFARYDSKYPVVPRSVVLESCQVYAWGNPRRRAVIYCEEIPNQIIVRGCSGFPDTPVVKVREGIDWQKYLEGARRRPHCLRFYIGGDNVEIRRGFDALPEPLQPYRWPPQAHRKSKHG